MSKEYKYMSTEERYEYARLYLEGARVSDIANHLRKHVSTMYRELQRGYTGNRDKNGRREYDPELADKRLMEAFENRGRRIGGNKKDE